MMEFMGRAREMALLEREYRRPRSLVLVTGRRRVGKTRLIREFIRDKDAVYFLTPDMNGPMILEELSKAISSQTGRTYGVFDTWEDALTAFAESSDGKRILVLDEFQYAVSSEKGFVSRLQRIWDDEEFSKRGIMLILCGSHISTMEGLDKDRRSPLYGRFTRHMVVNPLPFRDVMHEGDDFVDAVERYSVLGGVPRYMELFDDGPLRDNIEDNVMDPTSVMFDDPRVLLDDETRNRATYMSIMRAVAMGNRRLSEIASATEIESTTLGPYLRKLMEIHMLRRTVPATEKRPDRSKMGLYSVADAYTAFWFRFVHPHMSELMMGNSAQAMADFDRGFIESHVSFVFEEISREQIRTGEVDIGFIPSRVGSYWSRTTEIDVMAVNDDDRRVFVGECKFRSDRPVDRHVLNELRRKTEGLREIEGYEVVYGLFSVSGFDDRLLEESDVVLVDRGVVVKGPKGATDQRAPLRDHLDIRPPSTSGP